MKRSLTLFIAIVAFATVAAAATIVGGGKSLTSADPNFQSDKIITGGGIVRNTYEFTFDASFLVCDVTFRIEDENGKELSGGIHSVHVLHGTIDEHVDFSGDGPSHGKIDLTNQIPANTAFKVKVDATTNLGASAVKFSMSFSTKPPNVSQSCTDLGTFDAGTAAIVARPVLQADTGLLLPIHNTSGNPLNFGRFELVGDVPAIDTVTIPDKIFTVTMDGDHAFTLTGDSVAPGETIQVFIILTGGASTRGALLAIFNQS